MLEPKPEQFDARASCLEPLEIGRWDDRLGWHRILRGGLLFRGVNLALLQELLHKPLGVRRKSTSEVLCRLVRIYPTALLLDLLDERVDQLLLLPLLLEVLVVHIDEHFGGPPVQQDVLSRTPRVLEFVLGA